jgi:hypothetical protein
MTDIENFAGTERELSRPWLKTHRMVGLGFSVIFCAVGLIFLLIPGTVLGIFNDFSIAIGLDPSPTAGVGFFLILAAAYMYVVALLAWFMYRKPDNDTAPLVLLNAKFASSVLSLVFFFGISSSFVYLANGIVDGLIGVLVLILYRKMRNSR